MQEDTFWVKQTLNGDGQAFHHLIIKHYSAIFTIALSWSKNAEDAKDLVQEIFFEAYLDLASLKHHEQFRVWLRQIAKHQCHDWLRKRRETFISLDENVILETPSADETLILRETLAKVMKAIDELPESESQLLKERYFNDASYDELETKHGLSRNALAVRLFRAKRKVRARVEKLLAGAGTFLWHNTLKKMLMGGAEAMKIVVKTKLIITGIAIMVVLGGTGVFVWRSHQSVMEQSESQVSPITQKVFQQTSAKPMNIQNAQNNTEDKHIDQEMEKPQKDEANKAKTDNASNPAANASVVAIPQPKQKEETLMDRYNRIVNSPEYIQDRGREGDFFCR